MTTAPEKPATDAPTVHQALALVMRDTTPVGKDQINQHQRYRFRGIDDLMSAVAGPMRTHGVFLVPEVLDRAEQQRGKMVNVTLTMRYRIYGPAGDWIEAVVPGEASDTADKATNKALSAALKYLLLQVLMVPVDARSIDDGDRHHPENEQPAEQQPPADDERRPRRSKRAEPGPWEQEPPAEQPEQPAGPSRDFLADARAAESAAEVVDLYRAAEAEGAPPHYLDQLAAIGRDKRAAEQQHTAEDAGNGTAGEQGDEERADAVQAMYTAAEQAGISAAESDDAFRAAYGCMPAEATTEQITAHTADLRAATEGGAK